MESKKRIFTVLLVDGGGGRGVMPARILSYIEDKTREVLLQNVSRELEPIERKLATSKNLPEAEAEKLNRHFDRLMEKAEKYKKTGLCHHFDLVGGFSTGILILSLLCVPDKDNPGMPKYTAKDAEALYYEHLAGIFPSKSMFEKARKLFASSSFYDPTYLEKILSQKFGDTKVKDSLTNICIAATDLEKNAPVYFEHHIGKKDTSPENWSSALMHEAVRASSSAPVYLPAARVTTTPNENKPEEKMLHSMVDGGLFCGAVAEHLLETAKRMAPPDAEIFFIHVGTGIPDSSMTADEYNRQRNIDKLAGLLPHSINVSGTAVLRHLRGKLGNHFISMDSNLEGLNGAGTPVPTMEDSRPEVIKYLRNFSERALEENKSLADHTARIAAYRHEAEDHYQQTEPIRKKSLEKLYVIIDDQKTVKSLSTLYFQILDHRDGLKEVRNEDHDPLIEEFAQNLNDQDMRELENKVQYKRRELQGANPTKTGVTELINDLFLPAAQNLVSDKPRTIQPPKQKKSCGLINAFKSALGIKKKPPTNDNNGPQKNTLPPPTPAAA